MTKNTPKKDLTDKAKNILERVREYLANNTDKKGVFAKDIQANDTFNSVCASLSALASEEKGFFSKSKKQSGEKMLTFFEPTEKFFNYFEEKEESNN